MATKPLPVHGADVSHHQGTLDLARAKREGLQFLYHKATEGDSYTDPEYTARRRQAAAVKIPFGAYHFARPEVGDAVAEARRFIAVAAPKPGDLRPALDLETTEGLSFARLRTWAKTFSDEVVRLTGVLPVIYSPWDLGLPNFRWVPRYNRDNRRPDVPWDLFQFSGGAEFPGTPNTFPGLGAVDLNTFAPGKSLADILIPAKSVKPPKPPKPPTPTVDLLFQHSSLQFSDTPAQQASDAEKIYAADFDIVTGTEAGKDNPNYRLVAEAAERHDYRHFNRHSNFVSVKKDMIVSGSWDQGEVFVADNEESVGKGHDTTVPWVSFEHKLLGRITIAVVHYPTQGRTKSDPNWKINERIARALGDLAAAKGKGTGLFFVAGDFNMTFRTGPDPVFGEVFTSSWNELERYENTGHGNIDAVLSYDPDGRVSAKSVRALDDKEFPLHTDHFLVRSVFTVRILKR